MIWVGMSLGIGLSTWAVLYALLRWKQQKDREARWGQKWLR